MRPQNAAVTCKFYRLNNNLQAIANNYTNWPMLRILFPGPQPPAHRNTRRDYQKM
jgi:hypothetical protein